jgi:hypothetical protein
MRSLLLIIAFTASACGKAGVGEGELGADAGDEFPDRPDAGMLMPDDDVQMPPDAGPTAGPVTLTQSTDTTAIDVGSTVSCWTCPIGIPTYEECLLDVRTVNTTNRYFRKFSLPGSGINRPLTVTKLHLGLEFSTNFQPLFARLYTVAAAAPLADENLVPLTDYVGYEVPVIVPPVLNIGGFNASGVYELVFPNTVVPAGSELVVEIGVPDNFLFGDLLTLGSNSRGQTGPTYMAAADCGIGTITDGTAIRPTPEMALVLSVEGFTE